MGFALESQDNGRDISTFFPGLKFDGHELHLLGHVVLNRGRASEAVRSHSH